MAKQDNWSSKLGFILSAAGSAIGLGAIWKFPYTMGTNGGAVFFLLFVFFTFLIGAPVLVAEFVIGRSSRKSAVEAFASLVPDKFWPLTGLLGVITCFVLLSFYSVVGGWVLSYVFFALTGQLSGVEDYGAFFGSVIGNPTQVLLFQGLFMLAVVAVVRSGVSSGIEKANKYMMPSLFIMFVVLAVRSLTLDGAMSGVAFMFKPDWSYFTPETALSALGQAFFALSLGVSAMITYASYLDDKADLFRNANTIVWMNLAISILAGLVIFPAVFALGFEPNQGPGLIFAVLPAVFNHLPFGSLLFNIFMVLVLFATLTSAFAMLETATAAAISRRPEKRGLYTWLIGLGIFIVGIPSALSFSTWQDVKWLGDRDIFSSLDYLVTSWSMPLGALLTTCFVGWAWKKRQVMNDVRTGSNLSGKVADVWFFLLRYIAPVAIVIVFLNTLGWI
ncbi:MAG: sodium-dependent transporter [Neisseria sp.]|nr:sodium-dependent transporter [Neisseria sp.]